MIETRERKSKKKITRKEELVINHQISMSSNKSTPVRLKSDKMSVTSAISTGISTTVATLYESLVEESRSYGVNTDDNTSSFNNLMESETLSSVSQSMNNSHESNPNYQPYSQRPETYIVPIVFLFIYITGIIGNGTLIYVMLKEKLLRTPSYMFILNLAFGDLLVIICTVPFVGTIYTFESWPFGFIVCKASEFIRDVSNNVTVMTLCAMSIDRYRAAFSATIRSNVRTYYTAATTGASNSGNFICNLLGCSFLCNLSSVQLFKSIIKFVKSPTGIVMCSIWTVSLIAAFPTAYNSYILDFEIQGRNPIQVCYPYPHYPDPYYPRIVVASKCIFLYIIPVVIIGYCYVSIAIHLMYKTKSSLESHDYKNSIPSTHIKCTGNNRQNTMANTTTFNLTSFTANDDQVTSPFTRIVPVIRTPESPTSPSHNCDVTMSSYDASATVTSAATKHHHNINSTRRLSLSLALNEPYNDDCNVACSMSSDGTIYSAQQSSSSMRSSPLVSPWRIHSNVSSSSSIDCNKKGRVTTFTCRAVNSADTSNDSSHRVNRFASHCRFTFTDDSNVSFVGNDDDKNTFKVEKHSSTNINNNNTMYNKNTNQFVSQVDDNCNNDRLAVDVSGEETICDMTQCDMIQRPESINLYIKSSPSNTVSSKFNIPRSLTMNTVSHGTNESTGKLKLKDHLSSTKSNSELNDEQNNQCSNLNTFKLHHGHLNTSECERFISSKGKNNELIDHTNDSTDKHNQYLKDTVSLRSLKSRFFKLSGRSLPGSINGDENVKNFTSSNIDSNTVCVTVNSNRAFERARKKSQRAKMILLLVVIFLICFFPNHLYMIWFWFYPDAREKHYNAFWHYWRIMAFCLTFLNSTLNPITLYLTSDQFQRLFNRYLLKCDVSDEPHEPVSNSGDSSNPIVNQK